MNEFVQQYGDLFRGTQQLRNQLMEMVNDDDLRFTPGGTNPPLGELIRETGDIQRVYIDSVRTLKQDWFYRSSEPGIESSTEKLKAWFKQLDDEFITLMEGLTNEDLEKIVDRGFSFSMAVGSQLHTYRESILIHAGRISVYLKTLDKPLPDQWRWCIA